jgi:AbiTii-like protein
MATNSLVLELQKECLDGHTPILSVLRKALVIAKKLAVPGFQNWIEHELRGYGPDDQIPEYRTVTGQIKAWNPYRGWIPVMFDDASLARSLSRRPIGQAVGELENLLHDLGKDSSLQVPFDPELERQIMEAGGPPLQPSLHVTQAATQGILDQVRTAVLDWCLKLEEAGVLGEGMTFSPKEVQSASQINYIVNFHQGAAGAHIQQGSSNSSQSITTNVNTAALKSLTSEILEAINELNLESRQQQQLSAELKSVNAQLEAPQPSHSMITEGLKSVRTILEGCAASMLATGLLQKLGLFLS